LYFGPFQSTVYVCQASNYNFSDCGFIEQIIAILKMDLTDKSKMSKDKKQTE